MSWRKLITFDFHFPRCFVPRPVWDPYWQPWSCPAPWRMRSCKATSCKSVCASSSLLSDKRGCNSTPSIWPRWYLHQATITFLGLHFSRPVRIRSISSLQTCRTLGKLHRRLEAPQYRPFFLWLWNVNSAWFWNGLLGEEASNREAA